MDKGIVESFQFHEPSDSSLSESLEASRDEFEFSQEGEEDFVRLDATVTKDLLWEGYAREIMRQIQDMRKEAKYKLDEKIYAAWASDSKDVAGTIRVFGKEIAEKTLLAEFSRGHRPKEVFDIEKEFDLAEGAKIWLGVRNKK